MPLRGTATKPLRGASFHMPEASYRAAIKRGLQTSTPIHYRRWADQADAFSWKAGAVDGLRSEPGCQRAAPPFTINGQDRHRCHSGRHDGHLPSSPSPFGERRHAVSNSGRPDGSHTPRSAPRISPATILAIAGHRRPPTLPSHQKGMVRIDAGAGRRQLPRTCPLTTFDRQAHLVGRARQHPFTLPLFRHSGTADQQSRPPSGGSRRSGCPLPRNAGDGTSYRSRRAAFSWR